MSSTSPFAAFEWAIAWRYLRARRREGGISVIAWYSLIGVTLGVATLIVVQAVMIGFREEFTARILGANAHATVYHAPTTDEWGGIDRTIADYDVLVEQLAAIPGVTHAAPLIRGQVLASAAAREEQAGYLQALLNQYQKDVLQKVIEELEKFVKLEGYDIVLQDYTLEAAEAGFFKDNVYAQTLMSKPVLHVPGGVNNSYVTDITQTIIDRIK